jgi:[ribosomal protein S18]-alanine N-acetyltransferase
MIRQAENDDSGDIGRLLKTSIAGTGPNDPQWIMEQMARSTSVLLVAVEQNEVVGAIVGQIVLDEAEIHDVAVDPRFRRQGHARRLVQAFEHGAESQGACHSFLEVRRSNISAKQLYAAAGYTEQGHRTGYYSNGEDAIVMSKVLRPPQ